MLQETAARLNGLDNKKPLIICNEAHRFLVAEQMRDQKVDASILLEPVGRNTAPAIALAAFEALKTDNNAILLVLAADHVIENIDAFQKSILDLLPQVQEGKFGTLGIVPTEPATGYGYIKASGGRTEVSVVQEFVEKPNAEVAARYVETGYLWNSGMF